MKSANLRFVVMNLKSSHQQGCVLFPSTQLLGHRPGEGGGWGSTRAGTWPGADGGERRVVYGRDSLGSDSHGGSWNLHGVRREGRP